MGSLESDLDTASQWIAASLTASGYAADFSPSSLWEVDRFFDDQTAKGKPRSKGLLSSDLGARVFAIGAYTGEVIRRDVGGVWRTDDDDPAGEVNVELVRTRGPASSPCGE